ncbi:unnamed protein product [Triticum turgidum subsp. durum]|uniref:NB-ARC domain-containing protein n=1 Tax=Triticum turgidum subsp. durum TaxID=4567 RepID=A0A9R0ZNM9_TRITD|nr:unnamed protein product [Triticum turgidum subsp. durum]
MEAAVASALTKEVVLKLVALLSEKHKLSRGLKDDIRFIRTELDMISSARDSHMAAGRDPASRCLIVIDDINKQNWDVIKSILPREAKSRIIVTTALQSVANACSSGDGYVYKMSILNAEHSKVLLMKKVFFQGCSPELERGSTAIVEKCDGLPLALVCMAKFLLGENELTGSHCARVCHNLGHHMEKEADFTKLQQVLVNNYSSLSGYPLRTSLLYTSVFPNGRPIRRNTLIRRWLAEGYVQCQYKRSDLEVADENFRELIDRNIIRPIDASHNAKVKTCRTHGIMHEFMLHKSMSDNFITSLHDQNRSNFRHLFIQNHASGSTLSSNQRTSPASDDAAGSEKFRARSLTISGDAGEAASEFCRCELLRVLDLGECNDLEDSHLKDIHKLWHLKYLSLGGTISNLPKKIDKLHCLETLDLRKTKIEVLPVEVIGLPHLAYLFGKFKFGKKDLRKSEIAEFSQRKSKLKSLAGFYADGNPGFLQLMAHMKELKKVKIWCESTGADNKGLPDISKAVQKFAQDGMDTTGLSSAANDCIVVFGDSIGEIGDLMIAQHMLKNEDAAIVAMLPKVQEDLLASLCAAAGPAGNNLSMEYHAWGCSVSCVFSGRSVAGVHHAMQAARPW